MKLCQRWKRWIAAPLWVNVVYSLLEWIERPLEKGTDLTRYRYRLLDKHCQCESCQRRKAYV